ncbi:hypothetical protein [Gordonia sp. (in: high G+C Gram-positive bacteria)]|uniref:hypothetical protein n=1 Tax=Gordonia sp. (in: high G+C Gram-positive bacteria) TaxID=84139 RepID=UPI003527A4CB
MPAIIDDLDDVESLYSVDRDGLLRSAAMAGAQVRAVAEAQAEGVLEPLSTLRPRAVVIVTGGGTVGARASALVVAAFGGRIDVPLVVVPVLPGWIGPLDVVVVLGDDAGDPLLSDALARAARRRAEIVVLAPLEGPLAEAAGVGRRGAAEFVNLAPRLSIDPRFRFTGHVAGLSAVLTGLAAVRVAPRPEPLAELADRLDAEAAVGHPGQESFHNQAKLLAMRAVGHGLAWTGDTPAAAAAAAQAAAAFFEIGGVPAAVAEEARILAVLAGRGAPAPAESLFYDPEFDGPPARDPIRAFLVTLAARSWFAHRRIGDRAVDVVTEQVDDAGPPPANPSGGAEALADTPADLGAYLVIVVRAQLAAAYLALTGAE